MRIVQYESNGVRGCGVEREGAVFPTTYADTLTLIREGDRGLEDAESAPERSDPVSIDRLLAPLTEPARSSARTNPVVAGTVQTRPGGSPTRPAAASRRSGRRPRRARTR